MTRYFCKNGYGCKRNFTGCYSRELGWEMGQQITSDEDYDCFGKLTNQFTSEGSPIFVPNISVVYFQEQKFCLENDYFLIHGLGKCE